MSEWDIRIQCTVCGTRQRRNRSDSCEPGGPPFGHEPKATVKCVCDNCTAEAGHPMGDVATVHFVDYATESELAEDA